MDASIPAGLPVVTGAEFFAAMQPGDLVFCWGHYTISEEIEKFTNGPSHVLKVFLPWSTAPWLGLEAVIDHGVRICAFSDYMAYKGDLVLCRRPISFGQVLDELTLGFTLLDYKYDTIEFVSLVARHFINKFPLIQPADELFCSGLQQVIAEKSLPFNLPTVPWATPEQLFTEPSVRPLCRYVGPT